MVQHADLTGADLHEPKGVAAASANTVYVANGAGSGTWQKIGIGSVNDTSLLNINKEKITAYFPDIGTAKSIYIPFSDAATILKVTSVVDTAPTTTDTILTIYNASGATMGTITIAFSGSSAGDVDYNASLSNTSVLDNSYIRIATDGGCANAPNATILIDFEYA